MALMSYPNFPAITYKGYGGFLEKEECEERIFLEKEDCYTYSYSADSINFNSLT